MPVMFKGREVKVGDTLWRSRIWCGRTIEYEVTEVYPNTRMAVFIAKQSSGSASGWHDKILVREDRREDVDFHHWTKEEAEEDSAKCRIISNIEDAAKDVLRRAKRESLWLLPSDKLRPAYDAMAALLLAVADAEQEKEQNDA